MSGPLRGVRVVDLSRLLPGPACSWLLQGLGASVVKVEDPQAGDYLRAMPPLAEDGQGCWFAALNAGKGSVVLDLSQEEGREQLHRLLDAADVLVEGFRPGVLARLGLDPRGLLERHPRLIITSISGYGQEGPLRGLPGHDLGYVGLTGALSLAARHRGAPDPLPLQVADMGGGAFLAALRIAAALYERERSGRGAWLDVSMCEGVLAMVAPMAAAAAAGEQAQPGAEALTGGLPVYRCYPCRDGGLVAVAALEPRFQAALSIAIGQELPEGDEGMAALFASRDRDDWADLLGEACVTPVLSLEEALEHPQHRARGSVIGEGAARRVLPPFPGPHPWASEPAPQRGQDTVDALLAAWTSPPEPTCG